MPKILKAFTGSRKNTVRKYWVYRIRQVCRSVTAEMKMCTSQHSDLNITVLNEERFGGSNISFKKTCAT